MRTQRQRWRRMLLAHPGGRDTVMNSQSSTVSQDPDPEEEESLALIPHPQPQMELSHLTPKKQRVFPFWQVQNMWELGREDRSRHPDLPESCRRRSAG